MTTDEDKISSIYQQGKEQGPPADLDSAILKAAHEAVEKAPPADKSSVVKSPFSGGWPAMASIAAVLVITVILIPLIKQEEQPPAFDMADEKQGLMSEQDFPVRLNAVQQPVLKAEKSKKRSLFKTQSPRQETEQKLNMYQDSADTLGRGKQIVAEEAIETKRMAAPSSASVAAKPHESDVKPEVEVQQEGSSMLLADDDAVIDFLAAEKWLEKIRQLIEKGELDNAREELDKFQASYPDEEIDQSILRKINQQ